MTPEDILRAGISVLDKKNQDYTQHSRFENFERQAELMGWFEAEIDKAFACMVAVKLARIAALRNKKQTPNNEALVDTFMDLANYAALWGACVLADEVPIHIPTELDQLENQLKNQQKHQSNHVFAQKCVDPRSLR